MIKPSNINIIDKNIYGLNCIDNCSTKSFINDRSPKNMIRPTIPPLSTIASDFSAPKMYRSGYISAPAKSTMKIPAAIILKIPMTDESDSK